MNLTWFPVSATGPTQFIHHLSWSWCIDNTALCSLEFISEMNLSNTAKKCQTPFQLFHGREAKGGIWEEGSKNPAAASGGQHWSWKKNRKASGACLGRMVLVELCKLDVSLTQTAKLEGQLITVQFRGNGRQNCISSHAQLKDSYIWKGSFNINNNIYLPKTPAALWPSGNQLPIPKTPPCSQPTIHTDFDFTLSENFIFEG